jgi:phosphatidylinositol alpha-mannosyltransferase
MGHHTDVIAASGKEDGAGRDSLDERVEVHDGVITVSDTIVPVPYSGSVARVALSPAVWRRVKGVLRKGRYDIVHVHEPTVPVLPLAVLRHAEGAAVGTFHSYRESHRAYEYLRPVLDHVLDRLDGRIAVSEAARDYIASYFPGEYEIIPNGIEYERFASPLVEPIARFNDGRPNVLFVGRLEKRKGFQYLLAAFELVRQESPDARLIVVGAYGREERAPYVMEARRMGLHGVNFVGYVPPAELPRYYRTAHVFCAPAIGFESFGMVLAEAMASGVTLVASDIAGYRSVMTHDSEGLLVPPQDEKALARALLTVLRSPERRAQYGARGRTRAYSYRWERVATRIVEHYRRAVETRSVRMAEHADWEDRMTQLASRVWGALKVRSSPALRRRRGLRASRLRGRMGRRFRGW